MRNPRFVPTGGILAEVMTRTIQARRLLSPSPQVNRLIAGTLSRGLEKYPVQLVGVTFLSNHYHGLIHTPDAEALADFMGYINGNIAREVGRLHGWDGKFWANRYHVNLVSDEEVAQARRYKYQIAQGVKEGLVARPEDWPGVSCARALAHGGFLEGIWYDRTREYNEGRRKPRARRQTFPEEHQLRFAKLPCWSHLSDAEYQEAVQGLLEEVVEEGAAMRKAEGIVLRSRRAQQRKICRVNPWSRPKKAKKSIVQRFIAATREAKERMIAAYREFLEAYREAADELRRGNRNARFPVGCFPPGLPFVRDGSEATARSP